MTLIYKGVKGLLLRVETGYDLTGYVPATTLIKVKKPDGTAVGIVPDSINAILGYMYYTTRSTTFTAAGEYDIQGHLVTASKEIDGEIATISIAEPITV